MASPAYECQAPCGFVCFVAPLIQVLTKGDAQKGIRQSLGFGPKPKSHENVTEMSPTQNQNTKKVTKSSLLGDQFQNWCFTKTSPCGHQFVTENRIPFWASPFVKTWYACVYIYIYIICITYCIHIYIYIMRMNQRNVRCTYECDLYNVCDRH